MYLAKLGGYLIEKGTVIEMNQVEDFKFTVMAIESDRFHIRWLKGKSNGQLDTVPFSLFEGIGNPIELIEVAENATDPNRAWLYKRMGLDE